MRLGARMLRAPPPIWLKPPAFKHSHLCCARATLSAAMNDQNSCARKIDTWAFGSPGGAGAVRSYDSTARHAVHGAWHSANTVAHAVTETATNIATIGDGKGWNYPGTAHQAQRAGDHFQGVDPYKK